jgi:hypothetical protein
MDANVINTEDKLWSQIDLVIKPQGAVILYRAETDVLMIDV